MPGVVHQNLAHRRRGDAEEVGAILPGDAALIDHLQVGFVHERRAVHGAPGPPSAELAARNPAQVVVDERHEPVEGARFSLTMCQQRFGDGLLLGHGTS